MPEDREMLVPDWDKVQMKGPYTKPLRNSEKARLELGTQSRAAHCCGVHTNRLHCSNLNKSPGYGSYWPLNVVLSGQCLRRVRNWPSLHSHLRNKVGEKAPHTLLLEEKGTYRPEAKGELKPLNVKHQQRETTAFN